MADRDTVKGHLTEEGADIGDESAPDGYEKLTVYPKVYLNGFPKSGLHLAAMITLCLVETEAYKWPWAGTFRYHSWTNEWGPDWKIFQGISRLRENTYLKAHAGFRQDIAEFLYHLGAQVAFIYRDLRDVVISQSFHVISESENAMHADKDLYRNLPNQEARIIACIEGIDKYPGVISRWEQYADWLKVDWVHKMRYEDMRLEPFATYKKFTEYVYNRMAEVNGIELDLPEAKINAHVFRMVALAEKRNLSPTFRRGIPGEWAQHWTPKIDDAFEKVGGHEWNRRLEYE